MRTEQVASDYLRALEKDVVRMTSLLARVTPLIELSDSAPNLKLAVVDDCPKPDFQIVKGANGALHAAGISLGQEMTWDAGYRRVVKMEEAK